MTDNSLLPAAVTALGALIIVCLGVVINLLRSMNTTIRDMSAKVVEHSTLICAPNGLLDRVQSLHDWRNEIQRRELAEAHEQIVELTRRATDRT